MRITLFVTMALLCQIPSFSQSKYVEKFIDRYAENVDASSLSLNDWSLKLTSSFINKETGQKIRNKVTQLRLLTSDNAFLASNSDIRELISDLKKDDFESLIEVREKGNHVKFMIRENKETVTDVLMLVQGTDGFVLLSLEGLFKLNDLKNFHIDIEGGEHFKHLSKVKNRA
ncbi:MAG: DUF4252 domain-containing protein [Bacteroidota bacterium]